jgi:hypothetical protein
MAFLEQIVLVSFKKYMFSHFRLANMKEATEFLSGLSNSWVGVKENQVSGG